MVAPKKLLRTIIGFYPEVEMMSGCLAIICSCFLRQRVFQLVGTRSETIAN